MGDTDSVDLETTGLLDADTIPNANQSINCFSCGESMSGVFCHACGNKNDNYRRSIWSLGIELFASLTAFEGRIWRSLRSLIFKPGQMAREFSDGARQKWTSPIRLYLAMSLLLFGYTAVTKTQFIAFGAKAEKHSIIQAGLSDEYILPDAFFLERKSTIQKTISEEILSTLEDELADIVSDEPDGSDEDLKESLIVMRQSVKGFEDKLSKKPSPADAEKFRNSRDRLNKRIARWEKELQNRKGENTDVPVSKEDDTSLDSEGITNDDHTKINITGIDGKSFTLNSESMKRVMSIALRQPERINAPLNTWLPRIMFLMMPFSMLLGAIFIRGRNKAMLYDHLVHSAYIHAFSFLLLFAFIALVQFTPIKGLLWIYMIILLVYLPLSAKRMFGRSWFKSFLTSYGVGMIYSFIMLIVLFALILMGLSDIAKDVAVQKPS